MSNKLKAVMERAGHWSEADQAELANYAEEIECRHSGQHATSEELAAIDEADRSGTATEEQVAAAFLAFRRV